MFLQDTLSLPQKIYVAVKTCNKFHEERLKFLRKTWAKHAEHIGFYTDRLGTFISRFMLFDFNICQFNT